MSKDIFHEGERFVQERAGVRANAMLNARNVGSAIPAAAASFVAQQVWCVISVADIDGHLRSSLLVGESGFLTPDTDLQGLSVSLAHPVYASHQSPSASASASVSSVIAGNSIGMLLIDLATRRRLRINGVVSRVDASGFHLDIEEAFPACPRYIQRRQPESPSGGALHSDTDQACPDLTFLEALLPELDTLFLGTIGPNGRMDVSHRGGRSGFTVFRDGAIWIPDFSGNHMFNTLGNLQLDPRCGLLMPDFKQSRQIQISGTAKVHFELADTVTETGGTQRWIEFLPILDTVRSMPLPIAYTFVEPSPFNPG